MKLPALLRSSGLRYLLAGGAAFVFNLALLNLFREGLGWSIELSAVLAFWGTFGFSYAMQRIFTFQSANGMAGSMLRYTLLVVVNSLAVALIVTVANKYLGLGLGTSQLIATGATTMWNYFLYKHWVYANPAKSAVPMVVKAEEN